MHKGEPTDGYICSSTLVKEQIKFDPSIWSRQIIMQGNYDAMRLLEQKILMAVNAKYNEDFYNKHNGDGNFWIGHGGFSEQHKKALSEAAKKRTKQGRTGIKFTNESRAKLKIARNKRTDKPNLGKKHTAAARKKMSKARKSLVNLHELCSYAGKISQQKRALDPTYSLRQSESMKNIWAKRKAQKQFDVGG